MSDRSTQVNFLYEKRKRLQKTNTVPRITLNAQPSAKFKFSLRESTAASPSLYEEQTRGTPTHSSSAKELRVLDFLMEGGRTTPTPYYSSGSSTTFNESKLKSCNSNRVPTVYSKMMPNSMTTGPPLQDSQLSYHNHSTTRINNFTNSNNGGGKCRCFVDPDPNDQHQIPVVTPEGLSWRRLHMSRAKLKATSTTSELLSGFAMIAMVELQINEDTAVPEWLFIMFSVCTTILVAVHIFALMISTYILPNIDAISKLEICELVAESPHERMKGFIELAWAFSTVLGLFLFLVEVAILCWVKFWDYSFKAAIAATVIVLPVLVIFVGFAVHFYHSLIVHKCKSFVGDMQKLEDMKKRLDNVEI